MSTPSSLSSRYTRRMSSIRQPSSLHADNLSKREENQEAIRRQQLPSHESDERWNKACKAVASALRMTTEGVIQVLDISSGLLGLVQHAPGLQAAAETLVEIWKAVQMVEDNRTACFRLTERCGVILSALNEELEGSNETIEQFKRPYERLTESFHKVHLFVEKQKHRTFVERLLMRDKIQNEIADCDKALSDALGTFNVTITVRILKEILPLQVSQQSSTSTALLRRQLEQDMAQDWKNLRMLMLDAVEKQSDLEMIQVLGVGADEMPEAITALQHALKAQHETQGVRQPGPRRHHAASPLEENSLEQKFLEMGILALQRVSGLSAPLPMWRIYPSDIDWDESKLIGTGFSADVYRCSWKGHIVAVKRLKIAISYQLFTQEIDIWSSLSHPNVHTLLGASPVSIRPPFFVSPFYENGDLPSYLKRLPSIYSLDMFKMMHDIAKGMEYIHSNMVLHGDLKGNNILVNDQGLCLIADFGQSEIKAEISRLSRIQANADSGPRGALRWQAPEVMSGQIMVLTPEIDVYAFAICCIEVLGKGEVPWGLVSDDEVRHFVLRRNMRPQIPRLPDSEEWMPALLEILEKSWQQDPKARSTFTEIVQDIQNLRNAAKAVPRGAQPEGPCAPILEELSRTKDTAFVPANISDVHATEGAEQGDLEERMDELQYGTEFADIMRYTDCLPVPVQGTHSETSHFRKRAWWKDKKNIAIITITITFIVIIIIVVLIITTTNH